MNALSEEFIKFDKKIWRTIGSRFNAYRRLQRKQSASIFSISILSVYLLADAFVPEGSLPFEVEEWRKGFVVLSSVFILILSLLEARKSYELKAERLHNNAMELNFLYDEFKVCGDAEEKIKKMQRYHELIMSCPENHEPCDNALFQATHRHEFGICRFKSAWIQAANFLQTYWLYIVLVFSLPLLTICLLVSQGITK